MRFMGLVCAVGGWAIAVAGLLISSSNLIRMFFALGGISVTLFGIFGILNHYYLARAIWKK